MVNKPIENCILCLKTGKSYSPLIGGFTGLNQNGSVNVIYAGWICNICDSKLKSVNIHTPLNPLESLEKQNINIKEENLIDFLRKLIITTDK